MTHDYTCDDGDRAITCECNGQVGAGWTDGTCTCGALTFPVDCSEACSGISDADYAKCGLPPPPRAGAPSPGSSSSGSSGSTSSSSGGSSGF